MKRFQSRAEAEAFIEQTRASAVAGMRRSAIKSLGRTLRREARRRPALHDTLVLAAALADGGEAWLTTRSMRTLAELAQLVGDVRAQHALEELLAEQKVVN